MRAGISSYIKSFDVRPDQFCLWNRLLDVTSVQLPLNVSSFSLVTTSFLLYVAHAHIIRKAGVIITKPYH